MLLMMIIKVLLRGKIVQDYNYEEFIIYKLEIGIVFEIGNLLINIHVRIINLNK